MGQSEGAGHKRARVRHAVGAGISSVTTVGGGPPGKGWEPLQYANMPWEFSHHQVLLTGGQQAAEGPQHGRGERRGHVLTVSLSRRNLMLGTR